MFSRETRSELLDFIFRVHVLLITPKEVNRLLKVFLLQYSIFYCSAVRFDNMIHITDNISLHENEIKLEFIRASGPGGQNINKVSSAVQLRFDAARSPALSEAIRTRLKQIAGHRMTADGILVIKAQRHRTQDRNREDAINRLIALLRQAAHIPKQRRRTKPSAAARQKRLAAKRRRGEIKRGRRSVGIGMEDA